MNRPIGHALVDAYIHEGRLSDRINDLQKQIDDLANELDSHVVQGLKLHEERIIKTHEELRVHRRKIKGLRRQRKRLIKNTQRLQRAALEAELEPIRQAAIRKYGLAQDLPILRRDTTVFSVQPAHHTASLHDPIVANTARVLDSTRPSAVSHFDHGKSHVSTVRADFLRTTRANQIRFEKSQLAQGKQPPDYFNTEDAAAFSIRADLMLGNQVLLDRVIERPELLKLYPHTKRYLERVCSDPNDPIVEDARATLAAYPETLQRIPRRRLSSDEEQVHDAIQDCAKLSDRAKLVILVTTFIPRGRYMTYSAIQEWVRLATKGTVPCSHVVSALKKAQSEFDPDEVPVHRVIERNRGHWGSHMPSTTDKERADLFMDEECLVSCEGVISGSALEFYEIVGDMRKTAVEVYIKSFP